ncbi:YfiT family bacillithiol transferase [Maribacter sp. 2304DJ31-5]|uniref:YfiT family bacillithiol transferase n=1 Tax=Maribacter sp. 2304DJ31-5 TaxID=3386273 RepID=UPI0039BD15AD
MENLEKLRYPIGKFEMPIVVSSKQISEWIAVLESLPDKLSDLVMSLTDEQLDTPYRPEGWTVRQLVHHISDSHHHSYIRFKWAMTEETPLIKPYQEKEWSKLFDARTAPIQMSLNHLKAVHVKLVYFLRGLSPEDLGRRFRHPVGNTQTSLVENIGRYAWHSDHHFAHIQNLIKKKGW